MFLEKWTLGDYAAYPTAIGMLDTTSSVLHTAGGPAMGDFMTITMTERGHEARIAIEGKIEGEDSEKLGLALSSLNLTNIKKVVIDFERVTFIGSMGIGKLMALYRHLAETGGTVFLRNLPRDIYIMFKMINLDAIFAMSEAKQSSV